MLAVWKIAPALLAGNTVVIKPSPYTPLTTLEARRDPAPRAAAGGAERRSAAANELGGWMTAHPTLRKISFTGSVATGKKVTPPLPPT